MVWRLVNWAAVLVFWFGIVGVLLLERKYKLAERFTFGIVASSMFNAFLKFLIYVPRDFSWLPAFPSFHAQAAFFAATFVSLKYRKFSVVLFGLAVLAAVARVELGMHSWFEVIVGVALGIIFGYAFYRVKMAALDFKELARQIVHLSGLLLVPVAYFWGNISAALLAVAGTVLVAIAWKTKLRKYTDFFVREKEKDYSGAAIFLGIAALMLILFPWNIAAAAIVAVCIGDAFTAIYGKHFGFHTLWHSRKKTVEGSVFGFLAMFVALYFVLGTWLALLCAAIATVVETFPKVNDNITVPLAVVIVLKVVGL